MRILIVEDDKDIQDFLVRSLKAESFAVDSAFDGERGSFMARTNDYDCIILDFNLPKKNGLIVCEDIRKSGKSMPILILSVQSEIPDKITLLKAGADDYVTKPFSFEELIARIRALLRRPPLTITENLSIGDITLDSASQRVTRAGKEIHLTRKEFALLEYLIRNKGTVVSRGMIMEHVWNIESDPFSNTIEAHIRNLRKKLDDDSKPTIYNVPGRGYTIDLPRK